MLCRFFFQDTKGFDGWSLKKSILNTLLQAVKAIAGGVTTLQGQLIKGSGYLVTQKGKVSILLFLFLAGSIFYKIYKKISAHSIRW